MIYINHSYMKHPLVFAIVLCLLSAGSNAMSLTANSSGVLFVNGTASIRLNASYPMQDGSGYKDVNITLHDGHPVAVTGVEVKDGIGILISYPVSNPSVDSMVIDMRKVGELFFIHQVNFTLHLTATNFPELNSDFEGDTLSVSTNVRPKFQTPDGHVFLCDTTIPMDLTNGSQLTFTKTEFRSFDNNTDNWDTVPREVCPRDYESKPDIRIATGSAFAALIVAAIIGAVVLNCRKSSDE